MKWNLKKALSFEAVRLASQERVQQRLPQGLRAADGGSVEGSDEDRVTKRNPAANCRADRRSCRCNGCETVGEARPPGIAENSATTEASGEAVPSGLWTSADDTAGFKSVGKARPPGNAKQSATTEPELVESCGGAGLLGPENMA